MMKWYQGPLVRFGKRQFRSTFLGLMFVIAFTIFQMVMVPIVDPSLAVSLVVIDYGSMSDTARQIISEVLLVLILTGEILMIVLIIKKRENGAFMKRSKPGWLMVLALTLLLILTPNIIVLNYLSIGMASLACALYSFGFGAPTR